MPIIKVGQAQSNNIFIEIWIVFEHQSNLGTLGIDNHFERPFVSFIEDEVSLLIAPFCCTFGWFQVVQLAAQHLDGLVFQWQIQSYIFNIDDIRITKIFVEFSYLPPLDGCDRASEPVTPVPV